MFLPPANEVWGKVMFLQVSVILLTGGSRGVCVHGSGGGCMVPGGVCAWFGGVVGMVPGGAKVVHGPGGGGRTWWAPPGQYASYWNAFLFNSHSL